jgi:hypothetical protein
MVPLRVFVSLARMHKAMVGVVVVVEMGGVVGIVETGGCWLLLKRLGSGCC